MTPFEFLLFGLAVWRWSYMLVKEDGLFRAVYRFRVLLASLSSELDELLSCIYCTSIWVVGFLLLLRAVSTPAFEVIVYVGALSTLAILVHRIIERLSI